MIPILTAFRSIKRNDVLLLVNQKIIHGPAQMVDRTVQLQLAPMDAIALALGLLGAVPAVAIDAATIATLEKIVEVAKQ